MGSDGLARTPALPLTECPLGPGVLSLCKVCLDRSPIVRVEPKLTGVLLLRPVWGRRWREGGEEGCLEAEGAQKQ